MYVFCLKPALNFLPATSVSSFEQTIIYIKKQNTSSIRSEPHARPLKSTHQHSTLRVYGPSTSFCPGEAAPFFRPSRYGYDHFGSPLFELSPKECGPQNAKNCYFQVWTSFNTFRHRIPPVAILQGFRISGGFLHELPCGLIPRSIAVRNEGSEGQPRRRGRLEAIRLTEKMERVRFSIYYSRRILLFKVFRCCTLAWWSSQKWEATYWVQRNMGSSPLNNESQFEPQHFCDFADMINTKSVKFTCIH